LANFLRMPFFFDFEVGRVKKRKPKIIKDKKLRGEWAESVFMVRAGEAGLPVSKPWGDSNSFDCVVGRLGKFVAVQVKSTIAKLESGEGYICSTCSSHKAYRAGAFDFLAAYVVLEDAWYIIPAKLIRGLKSVSLCTQGQEAKYEGYRGAWHLLREAAGVGEEAQSVEESAEVKSVASHPMGALARLETATNHFRRYLERGGVAPQKQGDDF